PLTVVSRISHYYGTDSDNSFSYYDHVWRQATVDVSPQSINIGITGSTNIVEGDVASRQALYTIALDRAALDSVTVTYASSDGSAKIGSDYQGVSGSHTFAPGETSWTFPINILPDLQYEPDENFKISLSTVSSLSNDTIVSIKSGQSNVDTIISDGSLPKST
ncbi:Calx-beta domain-containing protein, partial [Methylobacterium sp. WL7]|uniref:Calx-beta domain-containing protein n=1 Tax=Methylobacterium sp. WL7 TaxID=2603900 RepID=UPI0011D716C2